MLCLFPGSISLAVQLSCFILWTDEFQNADLKIAQWESPDPRLSVLLTCSIRQVDTHRKVLLHWSSEDDHCANQMMVLWNN